MAGENVVIMQGTAGSDMTRIISLNNSSLLLWNELQDKEFEVYAVVLDKDICHIGNLELLVLQCVP